MAAFVESFVIHLIKYKISDLEGYNLTGNIIKSSTELIKNYTLLPTINVMKMCVKSFVLGIGVTLLIIPIMIKLKPHLIIDCIFLNKFSWTIGRNLSDPSEYDLIYARSFHLDVSEDSRIGVWHILPESLHKEIDIYNVEYSFARSLVTYRNKIVMYCHGNSDNRAGFHRVQLYKILSKLGFHVIAFDYRGFGDSTGQPSQDGVVEDTLAIYSWIKNHSNNEVIIWGHSLGSGIAVLTTKILCSKNQAPKALILESAFNNVASASFEYPLVKPFTIYNRWYEYTIGEALITMKVDFNSQKYISETTCDILMLHAQDDITVPYKLGIKLYNAALKKKTAGHIYFMSFAKRLNLGHCNIYKSEDLPDTIISFLDSITKKDSSYILPRMSLISN